MCDQAIADRLRRASHNAMSEGLVTGDLFRVQLAFALTYVAEVIDREDDAVVEGLRRAMAA